MRVRKAGMESGLGRRDCNVTAAHPPERASADMSLVAREKKISASENGHAIIVSCLIISSNKDLPATYELESVAGVVPAQAHHYANELKRRYFSWKKTVNRFLEQGIGKGAFVDKVV